MIQYTRTKKTTRILHEWVNLMASIITIVEGEISLGIRIQLTKCADHDIDWYFSLAMTSMQSWD